MNKTAIAIFRLIVYLILVYTNILPSTFELKLWLSDLIHGSHEPAMRNSGVVSLGMLLILVVSSYYIIQTFIYLFVGPALSGYNTSFRNFIRHVVLALRENGNDPYFWTSNSSSEASINGLEELLQYRDNMMSFMSNEDAAKLMSKTSHVDMLLSQPNLKQSQKALSYLNNKIALMDNSQALEYIQNDGSKLGI